MSEPKPRRPKGEGHLGIRNGRPYGYVTLEDGRRRYVYARKGETKTDVVRELARLRAKRDAGQLGAGDRQTLGEFLTWWLEEQVQGSKKAKTYRTYEQICRTHLIPQLGKRRLGDLTPQHVQAFLNERRAAGLSARTVHHLRAVLRNALGRAIRLGALKRNVAELAEPPRVPRQRIRPLTPAEAQRFREGLAGHRHEALYLVAMTLGLRVGEVLGLQWDDLSPDYSQLTCARQLDREGGVYVFAPHKRDTSAAYRTLALPAFVAEALRRHRVRQLEERLAAGEGWEGEGWNLIFPVESGAPMNEARPSHEVHRLLRQLGLPDQRFHDLRHSAASLMLASGATLKEVSEALGHSGIGITMNIYGHLYPEVKRVNADRLDAMFKRNAAE